MTRPDDAFFIRRGFITGGAGLDAATAMGRAVLTKNDIVDPAPALGDGLARGLASQHGLDAGVFTDRSAAQAGHGQVTPPRPPADLVLEVHTVSWGLGTPPAQWRHFAVYYDAEARLTDTRTERALAYEYCEGVDPRVLAAAKARVMSQADDLVGDFPSYDEMLADRARLLKTELARAVARCERKFQSALAISASATVRTPPPTGADPNDAGVEVAAGQ